MRKRWQKYEERYEGRCSSSYNLRCPVPEMSCVTVSWRRLEWQGKAMVCKALSKALRVRKTVESLIGHRFSAKMGALCAPVLKLLNVGTQRNNWDPENIKSLKFGIFQSMKRLKGFWNWFLSNVLSPRHFTDPKKYKILIERWRKRWKEN